jgi:hypothetical protein
MPAATPTNHTTGAFFGGLEEEIEEDEEPSGGMSFDEQSSIDYSQLIDPSIHTHLGSILDKSCHQTNIVEVASPLASVIEENSNDCLVTSLSDPICEEQGLQKPSASPSSKAEETHHSAAASAATNESTSRPQVARTPSKTMHTSNVDAIAYQRMEEESERFVAWAIHLVLGFFCGIVLLSSVMTFIVIENYGLVAMLGVVLVLCFTIFLFWFVDHTILSKDTKLRPIRQKIMHVVSVAKQAIAEEINLFKRDWNEHFLLTNGSVDDEESCPSVPETSAPARKKRRSVIFRALKTPLQMGRRIFRGRKKATTDQEPKYHPPNPENGIVA